MNDEILNKIINTYETPLYVFDIRKLKDRINYLKSNLPNNVALCYAIKANTFIIDDIENDVDRFEVCSPGEYEICKEKNINKTKVLISGIYKTPQVIKSMIDNNEDVNCYTIESMEQFELFKNCDISKKIDIMIRITSGNQFGIDREDAERIIKNREEYSNLNLKGIQYFSGTQKSIKSIKRELEKLDEFIEQLRSMYNYIPEELEYGGGFPVYYFENTEFEEEEYLQEFSSSINEMKYRGKIILELGRSIVADCGYYLTKIVDKKINKNQNYAIVDGGMNHIVYYGQSMAMRVPKCDIFPKRDNNNSENWNICGALCTINDILIKQFPISDLKIGDVLIFKNTGAYCPTEGISLFLSRDLPKILKLREDSSIELVRNNLPTYTLNM